MPAQIITTDDLREFKMELLSELKTMLTSHSNTNEKKYLKSSDIMEMLKISPGTLQNLRINGTLPYSKVGGVIYYDYDDIKKVLEENRIHNKF